MKNHTTNWVSPGNKVSRSFTSNGSVSLLTMDADKTWGYYYPYKDANRFELPFCLEVDVLSFTDSPRIRWRAKDNTTWNVGNITQTGHYKYIITDTSCTLSINDGTPTHLTLLENTEKTQGLGPFWELDASTDSVTYKNFIVYSI